MTDSNTLPSRPLVDAHVHIFDRHTPLASDKWRPNGEEATVENLMALFDQQGVDFGVISTSSEYGQFYDYFRQAMQRHPNLRATANVSPDITQGELQVMSAEGFTGTRLLWRPLQDVPDLTSGDYPRLLKRCADAGWHVHLTERPERIDATIKKLEQTGVRIVIDHMGMIDGGSGIEDPGFAAILAAVERGQCWVKLSGAFRFKNPSNARQAARALIAAGGWERLMWGSDWPFVGYMQTVQYSDAMEYLTDWVSDAEMRQRIGGETALRFYF